MKTQKTRKDARNIIKYLMRQGDSEAEAIRKVLKSYEIVEDYKEKITQKHADAKLKFYINVLGYTQEDSIKYIEDHFEIISQEEEDEIILQTGRDLGLIETQVEALK